MGHSSKSWYQATTRDSIEEQQRVQEQFFSACSQGTLKQVEMYLEDNPKALTWRDGGNWAALHYAAQNNTPDVVEFLATEAPNQVSALTDSGFSPLQLAAASAASLENCKILLALKANPNQRNQMGETVLHFLSREEHLPVLQLLASHGADPSLVAENGMTAIQQATKNNGIHVATEMQRLLDDRVLQERLAREAEERLRLSEISAYHEGISTTVAIDKTRIILKKAPPPKP